MGRDEQSRDPAVLTPNRRKYLQLMGLGTSLALAGCTSGGDGSTEDTDTPTAADDDDSTPTESTPEPTTATMADLSGGHLRVGDGRDAQNMNPMVGIYADYMMMEYMYSRLTQLNEEVEVIPALATDWEHQGDATAWTFTLREGVIFPNTDGREVMAEDVKASAEALFDDELTAQDGTAHVGDVDSIEVEDDYRLSIVLNSPDLFYPKRIAENGNLFNILPKNVIENRWDEVSTTDFGTGPFNMVERVSGDKIVLERNPEYFRTDEEGRQLPYVDKLTWDITPDSLARISALRDERLDGLLNVNQTQLTRIAADDDINIQRFTTPGFRLAVLNTKLELEDGSKPFANVQVRKAMKHAMDRTEMQAAAADTVAIGHHDPIPPNMEFYNPFPKGLEFGTTAQVDQARELLDQAGYADGFSLPVPFVYQVDNDPRVGTFATLFQEQMKKVGIEFELQQVSSDTWISKHWNNDDSFYYSSWAPRLVDPTVHKLALHTDSSWNTSNWSNEDYDEQWETAMNATDIETFKDAFYEMQRIHHLEGGWLIWGFVRAHAPYNTYVENVDLRPTTNKKPYWNAHLADEAPTS